MEKEKAGEESHVAGESGRKKKKGRSPKSVPTQEKTRKRLEKISWQLMITGEEAERGKFITRNKIERSPTTNEIEIEKRREKEDQIA